MFPLAVYQTKHTCDKPEKVSHSHISYFMLHSQRLPYRHLCNRGVGTGGGWGGLSPPKISKGVVTIGSGIKTCTTHYRYTVNGAHTSLLKVIL